MTREFDLSKKIESAELIVSSQGEEILKEFINIVKDEIDDAQEDYGNLDWISKEQALNIIKKRAGNKFQ